MPFPLLTTFMPGGTSRIASEATTEDRREIGTGSTGDGTIVHDIAEGNQDARHAALARLGFGGSTLSLEEARVEPTGLAPLDLRNNYTSTLPSAVTPFAAQYPLTTIASIGAIGTAVLITSSALTARLLRQAFRASAVRTAKADAQEIKEQLFDLERRLSGEVSGMRAELRRVQQDSKGDRRSVVEAASLQRVMMTRLDRLDKTFNEIRDRLDTTEVPPVSPTAGNPATEDTTPVEDVKPKKRKKTKVKASADQSSSESTAATQGDSTVSPVEDSSEEPIMSFADIAKAIKGVQADYASYTPSARAEPRRKTTADEGAGQEDGRTAIDSASERTPTGTTASQATASSAAIASSAANAPRVTGPDITKAVPLDMLEAELGRALLQPDIPHGGALDTIAEAITRTNEVPTQTQEDPFEPRPVDHSQPSPPPRAERKEPARPKDHGSDILYGIDDSGGWIAHLRSAPRERGWHWVPVSVDFNQQNWMEAVGPGFSVHSRARYTERRSSELHRVHCNPQPELIELDKQIWRLERDADGWVVVERISTA